jgi:hypothetical protein
MLLRLSRSWGEDGSVETPWEQIVKDAAGCELRIGPVERQIKARWEMRSAKRETRTDHSRGSLLFVQGALRNQVVNLAARLTFFYVEDSDAAIQVHEASLRGEYPISTFSGSGRRASMTVSKDWHSFRGAARISHTRKSVANETTSDLGIGIELSYHQ